MYYSKNNQNRLNGILRNLNQKLVQASSNCFLIKSNIWNFCVFEIGGSSLRSQTENSEFRERCIHLDGKFSFLYFFFSQQLERPDWIGFYVFSSIKSSFRNWELRWLRNDSSVPLPNRKYHQNGKDIERNCCPLISFFIIFLY